jgi:hypothetical protein
MTTPEDHVPANIDIIIDSLQNLPGVISVEVIESDSNGCDNTIWVKQATVTFENDPEPIIVELF